MRHAIARAAAYRLPLIQKPLVFLQSWETHELDLIPLSSIATTQSIFVFLIFPKEK